MNDQYAQILKYTMKMELDGANFFKEKSEQFVNPTTRDLFDRLSKVEMTHYHYLEKELQKYTGDSEHYHMDTEFLKNEETAKIFKEREKSEKLDITVEQSDVPDLTVLRMAYLIERDFAEFYRDAKEMVEDEELKKLFETLAGWEDTHEKLFKQEYNRLKMEYLSMPWGG